MAYIGKSPAVGNFVKLDAISTSSTNTYNLTVDSVAFVPESANHMLVSLNGVIQAPLSSFSVSGSTITFIPSSGTLSSSDSIDFIMVYGNVLDIGTASRPESNRLWIELCYNICCNIQRWHMTKRWHFTPQNINGSEIDPWN